MQPVLTERKGFVFIITINRPELRNAVDGDTAQALAEAFREFEGDASARVAILQGSGGHFCAGADLKAISGQGGSPNRLSIGGDGPMGPTRMLLSKPVIAAISGFAVAGGLELACWCDMRVMEESAVMGVFCRRWGVPLVDGGTIRLPRLVGMGRAMDLILTGRPVGAQEALQMGLANRVVKDGDALNAALELANQLASFPQNCLRSDRLSTYQQWGMGIDDAMVNEFQLGMQTIETAETLQGATRFASGKGRHGDFSTN